MNARNHSTLRIARIVLIGWTFLSALGPILATLFAQGNLTPPGAPAPTMKSLDPVELRTPISSLPVNTSNYFIAAGNSVGPTHTAATMLRNNNPNASFWF